MGQKVAIIGLGYTPFRPLSPEVHFREMIFEAAVKAYGDAGIEPKDVDTFVSVSEDFMEGTAIFDEYVPDQLGAVLKPVHTITQEGLVGLISVFLQLKTGKFKIGLIEAHSKASNMISKSRLEALALDPSFVRPLKINPLFIAGLDKFAYMTDNGVDEEVILRVVEKNKYNALKNPRGCYGSILKIEDLLESPYVSFPLREIEVAPPSDGAVVIILATEDVAKSLRKEPLIFVEGVGWAEYSPNLESWVWGDAIYTRLSARQAFDMAKIRSPLEEIDIIELDDRFAHKELVHLEALGILDFGESGYLLSEGFFDLDGFLPVNPSGGCLGMGNAYECNGLRSVAELVLQLRGEAGENQVEGAEVGVAVSWKGLSTQMGGVVVLRKE